METRFLWCHCHGCYDVTETLQRNNKIISFANHDITLMTSLIFEQQIVFYDITQEQQILSDFEFRKVNKTQISF